MKISIRLLNGDVLEYQAKLRRGVASYLSNMERMMVRVLDHFEVKFSTHRVHLIFGDEEERLTDIYRRHNSYKDEKEQTEEIQEILQSSNTWFHQVMNSERVLTNNMELSAIVIPLDNPFPELTAELVDWEEQPIQFEE
jgi:hypothetical protein